MNEISDKEKQLEIERKQIWYEWILILKSCLYMAIIMLIITLIIGVIQVL